MTDPVACRQPPPEPDDPGKQGIRADAPRSTRPRPPGADHEPILLGDEHNHDRPPAPPSRTRSTALVGREFVMDGGRFSLGFTFALLVFGAMLLASILIAPAYWWQFGLAYLVPIATSIVLLMGKHNPRILRFTADGIEATRPDERLLYGDILEVHAPARMPRAKRNFPIDLLHAQGYFTIPASVKAQSQELFDYLEAQSLGVRDIPKVAPILRDFLKQQHALHGDQEICIYRPRTQAGPAKSFGRGLWPGASLLVSGLGFGVLGAVTGQSEIYAPCAAMCALGGIIFLASVIHGIWARAGTHLKNAQQAMLIIAPDGLALVQGELKGELRWRDVKKVKAPGYAAGAHVPVIQLKLDGAEIVLTDVYHWPLAHVMAQIEKHWRH